MAETFLLKSRQGLLMLLVGLFLFNYAETQLEESFKSDSAYLRGFQTAHVFQDLEGGALFDSQHLAPLWGVAAFSFSYFFLLPLLLAAIGWILWKKPTIRPFRVYTLSLLFNYFLSLPFFLFFPVPERWAHPESNAILLSDLLTTRLIETLRPISGLDNCFPSIHVSFSLIVIFMAYCYGMRFRHSILFLGLSIILSTLALGIHWAPDIIFGLIMGALSCTLALAADRKCTAGTTEAVETPRTIPLETRTEPLVSAPPQKHIAFISYRRDQGSEVARIIRTELRHRGQSCFLDVENLKAEHFGNRLLQEIENAPNFILVLAPGSLDRCGDPEDWLRREIAHAISNQRNIIPLLLNGFQFPASENLPEDMRGVERHNGVSYSHEYFNATIDKLVSFLRPS